MHQVKIYQIIKDAEVMSDVDKIQFNTNLREAGLDSLDMANVLLTIEETFGVKIEDEEMPQATTIDAIADLVSRKQSLNA